MNRENSNQIYIDKWGIDLTGQRMIYNPWPVDEKYNYRNPSKNEIDIHYSVSGKAVRETTKYFHTCGGDSDELVFLLNNHTVNEQFKMSGSELLDEKRWYNNEYYFYFINFTKRLIGRYNFHYGENLSGSLSRHHFIYEKGFIEHNAWGTDKNGEKVKESSTENFYNIYLYIKNNYPEQVINRILEYLNASLKRQNKVMDISYFTNSNYWYSVELLGFFYSFVVITTNNNQIISKSGLYGGSRLMRSFLRTFTTPRTVYKSIPGLAKKYNNTLTYNILKLNNNSCMIKIERKAKYNDTLKPFEKSINIYNEQLHISILQQIPQIIFKGKNAEYIPVKSSLAGDDFFIGKFIWSHQLRKVTLLEVILAVCALTGIYFFYLQDKFIIMLLIFISYLFYYFIKTIITQKQYLKQFIRDFEEIYKDKEEVTYQLQAEKDLLEIKVNERTKELSEAYIKLKELDKAKTNFFDNISHELRIPLTMISAPLQSILNGKYGKTISTSHEMLNIMDKNCRKLIRLINSLLDYSKIKNKKFPQQKQSIDIIKRIKLFIAEVESLTSNKNIDVQFVNQQNINSLFVMFDPYLFESIFFNLIFNAIKFTSSGGKIVVTFNFSLIQKEFRISIKDTGIGIPAEKIDTIFEKFHQIDNSANRKYEGTGIGLSLVKEIISLLNGRITVESKVDIGSNFTLFFPLELSDRKSNAKTENNSSVKGQLQQKMSSPGIKFCTLYDKKKAIFIVEDNRDMIKYLSSILKTEYDLIIACNGTEALEKIKINKKPDLILADIMMPKMDGMEFRKIITKNSNYNHIPFIFLTAKASIKDRLKCLESGAIDYISKPFSIDDLQAKIKSVIHNRDIIYNSAMKKIQNRIINIFDNKDDIDHTYELIEKRGNYYNLTKREIEILKYMYEGYQDKEIGNKLNIATKTVSNHIYHIFEKADISNRVELIKTFLR